MLKSSTKQVNKVTVILLTLIMSMTGFMGSMFYAYAKLNMAHPLENIRAVVLEPVYAGQDLIEFTGTFDRKVSCTLQHFRLDLTNMKTTDMISLNQKHLAVVPKPDRGPGTGMNIDFALIMPDTMYPGRWRPAFSGAYVCRYGIFTDFKRVHVTADSFMVVEKD